MDNWMSVRSQGEVLMVLRDSFYLAELPFNTEATHASAEIELIKVVRGACALSITRIKWPQALKNYRLTIPIFTLTGEQINCEGRTRILPSQRTKHDNCVAKSFVTKGVRAACCAVEFNSSFANISCMHLTSMHMNTTNNKETQRENANILALIPPWPPLGCSGLSARDTRSP